jgi:predicted oxidoreductase
MKSTTDHYPSFSRMVAGVMKWGEWGSQLSASEMLHLIEGCIDLGVTTFDHADIYGNYTTEAEFGAALAGKSALRSKIQLVSKCGIQLVTSNRPSHQLKSYNYQKGHIVQSVEQSLRNLQTDYIDVYLLHRPSPLMHPEVIAEAFAQLKKEGKVLAFGVSNFTPSQVDLIRDHFPLVTNQIEAHVFRRAPFLDGTLDQCIRYGLRPMAWSPLGGGRIFGTGLDASGKRVKRLGEVLAEQYGLALDQLLLAWLLHHPSGIHPVLGTSKLERIETAVAALEVQLTDEDWFKLWEASLGQEVP